MTGSGNQPTSRVPAGTVLLWLLAAAVAVFMVVPIGYLAVRAAAAGDGVWALVLRPRTLQLLGHTLLLAAVVTGLALVLSVPLAWLTTRSDLPGRRFWSVALAVPLAIPSYLGAYTLLAAIGPRGMVQQLLDGWGLGLRVPDITGFPGAVLALTLFSYPYIYLNTRAALLRLDPAWEEAARSLSSSPWSTFRRVVLPNLRPALVSGALLVSLYVFSDFGAVSFMRFDTFTRVIYLQYQAAFDRTYGAALSLVLVFCTLLVLVAEFATRGRARYYRQGPGTQRRAPVTRLGPWRWPALILCGSVVTAAIILPVAVIFYWLARGVAGGQGLAAVARAALNSVGVGLLGAILCVLLALPVALITSRNTGPAARLLEGATYIGYGLPGLVVALGLIFFAVNTARFMYQTLLLLLLAYVIMFLPQAMGAWRSALLQVNPRLEEAARSLGYGPWHAMFRVTLPLVMPGVLAGAALVFLTVLKELPATLLLSPIGFSTLATLIWTGTSEAFYARAAPAALLLLLASFLSVFFLFTGERTDLLPIWLRFLRRSSQ